jgi:hypothetical protein
MNERPFLPRRLALVLALPLVVAACDANPTAPTVTAESPNLIVFSGENAPPTVQIVTPAEGELFALSSGVASVSLSAALADPDPGDVHSCDVDWEGGATAGVVDEFDGSGTCTGTFDYTAPGVYTIQVTVTDLLGESATDSVMIVVYDPSGGFVTGGGWVTAAPGSFPANAALTGKATFGFVAKYKKGAAVPDGNTEFQFHAAGMNFHATSYDWLVVAGTKAMYKGIGRINNSGSYQFMLTASDGKNSSDPDRFRMRIWDAGGLIFDNQMGAGDNDDPATALGGGNIVIHNK